MKKINQIKITYQNINIPFDLLREFYKIFETMMNTFFIDTF